ncbi:MAG TPA: UdgX family uracil-DNA binding protein [Bryobacteraceae bacterium]|nr:UdgX family uracil-DNA binding protein [Bryobacteraceae bacterium]
MAEQTPSAREWIPSNPTLPKLAAAVQRCHGCDLYRHATQAVFGEGPANAPVFMVGEQPGDQEDRQGHPFVGPAGRILDKALAEVGVDRSLVYVTNAVKHFKFEERGKRRIHARPRTAEISACRPWLEAELEIVRPKLIVCLGATAAQSLMGSSFRVTRDRGKLFETRWSGRLLATIHPSALLRMPERDRAAREYELFLADLSVIPRELAS